MAVKCVKKIIELCCLTAVCMSVSSCALTDWIAPNNDNSGEESAAETSTTTERKIETTKTARPQAVIDEDDEDMEGYTSSTTAGTNEPLENKDNSVDEYDQNIRATMTHHTTVTTLYTTPKKTSSAKSSLSSKAKTTKKTSVSTTTKFNADSLHALSDADRYSQSVKYKVVSDTTYLNLRFGPSKSYSVQLKIPDAAEITATGETTDTQNQRWLYVTYNGTSGWVLASLTVKK